ncbi:MAG: hypothetical protein JSW72_06625 [Candidatus Bathyarchaeota archaeon]|nr:MAG: hypothetical protein JSW72_06625 [Candidatus Bathyarchaeota archaeon]
MPEGSQRKNPAEALAMKEHEGFILTKPEYIEIASGYSISVKYDKNGQAIIYVKKYGDVDTKGLRREIERNYPGAAIQGLEKQKIIRVEKTHEEKAEKPRAGHRKTK